MISIFTDAEMKAFRKRLNGDYSDPTSIFANRVRPKLKELLAWQTPKLKAQIRKALQPQRKIKENEPAIPNEEKSFEEFKQGVGY